VTLLPRLTTLALATLLAVGAAQAQAVRTERNLSMDLANQIAAVGVGGAPGDHLDGQCAMAALDPVKDLPK
jgi:hypothetical protein